MLVQEVVDRLVPLAVELLVGRRVPPVLVELAVTEARDLTEDVQNALPENVDDEDHEQRQREHQPPDQLVVADLVSALHPGNYVVAQQDVAGEDAADRRERFLDNVAHAEAGERNYGSKNISVCN